MNIYRRIIANLGIIVLGVVGVALAQDPWLMETDVPDEPLAWALFSFDGESDVNSDDPEMAFGKVRVTEIDVMSSFPVATMDDFTLLGGVGWQWTRFEFTDLHDDINVYAVTVPISLLYTGIDRWMLLGNITPGLYTDFNGFDRNDYRGTVYGMAFYRWMPNVDLTLGVSYDCIFGDDTVYPLGGAIWCLGDDWQLRLLFPMPQIIYAPVEKLVFFVDARPTGNKWNIRPAGEDADYDFKLESWRIGTGVEYELFSHVWLHGGGGIHVDRKYDVHNDNDKLLDADIDDTWFVRAGIVLR